MIHLRILGALLAFAAIGQCRDQSPAPSQPAPDPGPTGAIIEAHAQDPDAHRFIKDVRL